MLNRTVAAMPITAVDSRLTLDPEVARRLGYRVVDALVERHERLPGLPVVLPAGRDDMEAHLREPLPEHGSDPEVVLETVLRDVLPPGLRIDHPRYFAFIPGPGNPVGVLADSLAAGFGDVCALPATTAGLFVSGGSMASPEASGRARRCTSPTRPTPRWSAPCACWASATCACSPPTATSG